VCSSAYVLISCISHKTIEAFYSCIGQIVASVCSVVFSGSLRGAVLVVACFGCELVGKVMVYGTECRKFVGK
jgi:hypothetical protein